MIQCIAGMTDLFRFFPLYISKFAQTVNQLGIGCFVDDGLDMSETIAWITGVIVLEPIPGQSIPSPFADFWTTKSDEP
jgi:hypothetical protein